MLKPWFQKFCSITHVWSIYTFHNFRDFQWTTEWAEQKQHRITKDIDVQKITGLNMYICPFAFYDLIGHTFLEFKLNNEENFCLSVEGQQKIGEDYSFWKAIWPGYRTRFLRGTPQDIIGLRILRKERLIKYPLHLKLTNIKTLFDDLVQATNDSKNHDQKYGMIFNNCASSLWKIARKHLPLSKWHFGLLFNRFLPRFLSKLGVVKLEERRKINWDAIKN